MPAAPPRIVTSGWPRAVPAFAADPEATLSELEGWRGAELEGDLLVEYVPRARASAEELPCWYEPGTQRLLVVRGEGASVGRGALVRALVHALQDQRFGLARLHEEARDEDAARALGAMIEGEAALAVSELFPGEVGHAAVLPARGPIAPERFQEVFNRDAGQRFVRALREAGGWERVDAAFRDPPRRTAEILQPSRYLERTRERDEAQLFAAWRLTSFVVGEYEPLGAYEIQRLLARSEELRPRAAELASTVIAGKRLRAPETLWTILLSDAAAARAMIEAVWTVGATCVEAASPDPRMVSFSPPPDFQL